MFKSVLVANRGEIARRIFATCRRMGISTVAVYSEPDAGAPHVRDADKAVLIGPAAARESYLVGEKIISAAQSSRAQAIHPGYGFLSENPDFAEAVIAAGLVWIGPPPDAIRKMALKDAAKALMQKAGVPVTPGYLGDDQSDAALAWEAERIGFPILIKAVAGGGGKGMRRADNPAEFADGLAAARREAMAAFGDDRVLIETYVSAPRHIEVQVFGDSHGNLVHLFERDCTVQRRHQKVIEEAPAPGIPEDARAAITTAAVKAAKAVGYVGAGTVEFIADARDGLRADRIWFMEMNTRLQVEHPVTEMITGIDLVEWQLRVAGGESLPLRQEQIMLDGHAIEARLYAENPHSGFLPSMGSLDHFRLPSTVRVDTGVEQGNAISPFYDPMMAKLIAHASDRGGAISKLRDACSRVEVWPVKTNAGFLVRCLESMDFISGQIDTGFIDRNVSELAALAVPSDAALSAAANKVLESSNRKAPFGPWAGLTGFRINQSVERKARLFYEGRPIVSPAVDRPLRSTLVTNYDEIVVFEDGNAFSFSQSPPTPSEDGAVGDGQIRAPMPGRVTQLAVQVGDKVVKGQRLLVLEAMKMEHALLAPFDGAIKDLSVAVGAQVTEGALLVVLSSDSEQ